AVWGARSAGRVGEAELGRAPTVSTKEKTRTEAAASVHTTEEYSAILSAFVHSGSSGRSSASVLCRRSRPPAVRGRMSTANMSAPTVSDIAMLNRNFAAGRPKRTTVPGSLSRVGFAALVKNSAATPTQKPRRTTMGTAALWVKRVIGSKTGELTARGPPLLT